MIAQLQETKIMTAIMDGTYEKDEELKLEIMNAIAEQGRPAYI